MEHSGSRATRQLMNVRFRGTRANTCAGVNSGWGDKAIVRVLWLTQGVTDHDRRFTTLLARSGYEVRYLALDRYDGVPPLPEGVIWEDWGERPTGAARVPSAMHDLLPGLRDVLDRVQADVIHAGPVPTAGFLAALSGFHPLVTMSWGSDLLVEAGQGPDWARATSRALAAADVFVCDCRSVLDRARDFAPIADPDVVLLPWGTDLERFAPARGPSPVRAALGASRNHFVVLCTRSWEPIYGIETLIEGFGRARERDPRIRLVLLGSGSLASQVERQIVENGLDAAVSRPGTVEHHELPEWFRAADLYASCAASDGTSVSLLEAMASGLPVLVTDIPSNREWVTSGENGWLVRGGDAEAVSEALLNAASLDLATRAEFGLRNRRVVEERADWKANGGRLLEAYTRLVPGPSAKPPNA